MAEINNDTYAAIAAAAGQAKIAMNIMILPKNNNPYRANTTQNFYS